MAPPSNQHQYTRESIWACLPATTRGQPIQLDAHPNGSSFLYTNGRTVIIRDLKDPQSCTEYTGHSFPVTVARYSPSGYYVASGDSRGHLRIWDCTQPEQILKCEYQLLSGSILDLSWDSESKRIVAVGEGREKFAGAILFDTGSSVGEISGHSKPINAVALKPTRPFRAVTCSNDMTVNFYHGVPFKFAQSATDHSRFVTDVTYSPSGLFFISVGLDSKIVLYDGTTGAKVQEIVDDANSHTAGIFSVAWAPDSKQFLTSSSDCSVKLWDFESRKVLKTWKFGDQSIPASPMNHQVATLWSKDNILLSVSLSGDIHYLDLENGTVSRTLTGHQKTITSLAYTVKHKCLVTGSYDGSVCQWYEAQDGSATKSHSDQSLSQVQDLCIDEHRNEIVSIHLDDTLRTCALQALDQPPSPQIKLPSQPKRIAITSTGIKYIVTVQGLIMVDVAGSITPIPNTQLTTDDELTAIAVSSDSTYMALGTVNKNTFLYKLNGGTIDPTSPVHADQSKGQVTAIAFNPSGEFIAVGDSSGKIVVYDIAMHMKLNQWGFHTARITSIHFDATGMYACSTSLDTSVGVWSVSTPASHVLIRNAHVDAAHSAVWVAEDLIASVGNDGCVKHWKLPKLPGA